MSSESKAAKAYRAAKQTLRHYEDKEEARGNHWQSAKNRLDAALDDGRSKNTVRKAQNYERNCREKYDDAIADRRDAEKALDNAQRRLELEEAASSRLGGDVGEMVGKYAYEYGSSRKYY